MLHFQNIKFSLSVNSEKLWPLSDKQMLNFHSHGLKPDQWAGFLSKNLSRCQICCDSLWHFLQKGKSHGYFFFVHYAQGLAVEEAAAKLYTKKVKTKEGLVEEKLRRSGHDRASGRLERFCGGENLKEQLPRSRGGTREGLWKKSMKTPSFQDLFCSSVPSPSPYFTGEPIFHILLAKDTAKESKRLCRTEHHSPSLGLGGIFNAKRN